MRAARLPLTGLGICALFACEDARQAAPYVVAVFSSGTDLVFAEQTSRRLLWYDLLASQSNAEAAVTELEGRPLAVLCVDRGGRVTPEGACRGTLIACVARSDGFAVQRIVLHTRVAFREVPVLVDCSQMTVVDENTLVLLAPELYTVGVSRFLHKTATDPTTPFGSVVRLPRRPDEDGSVIDIADVSRGIAPVGAEAEALQRVEVSESHVVLVFGSFVGIMDLTNDGLAYRFVDLFEADGAALAPQAAILYTGLKSTLVAFRSSARNLYLASFQAALDLKGRSVPLRMTSIAAFADRPVPKAERHERALLLTRPDVDGHSHLRVLDPELVEFAEQDYLLPGAADTLLPLFSSPDVAASTRASQFLVWEAGQQNDHLSLVTPELLAVPAAIAVSHYPVPAPFTQATTLGDDDVLLAGPTSGPPLQLLNLSDGSVISLLDEGETRAGEVAVLGGYISLVVEHEDQWELRLSTRDGARAPSIPLHAPPRQRVSNTAEPCSNPSDAAGSICISDGWRTALLFDHPLGELTVIAGQPPAVRYSVTGFLGASTWGHEP